MKYETIIDELSRQLKLDPDRQQVEVDGRNYPYSFELHNGRYLLRIGTVLHVIDNVRHEGSTVEFTLDGTWYEAEVRDERDLLLDRLGFDRASDAGKGRLNAPMPGKILELMVGEGDQVELGTPVAILEAMKMENELKAPAAGVVTAVAVTTGDSVEKNALILEIESSG